MERVSWSIHGETQGRLPAFRALPHLFSSQFSPRDFTEHSGPPHPAGAENRRLAQRSQPLPPGKPRPGEWGSSQPAVRGRTGARLDYDSQDALGGARGRRPRGRGLGLGGRQGNPAPLRSSSDTKPDFTTS